MDQFEIQRLTAQAREALEHGNDVRALAIADQLIAAVGDDPAVRAIRAQALLSSDNAEEAFAEARRLVQLDSQNEHAHRLLGLAAWRSERLTAAQESLQRAVRLSGRKPELLAEYAWFMASQRGPRLAERAARQAVDADRTSSTAWAALGLVQYRLHRRQDAEVSLRRALELDPNDLYAQSAMVVLLQDQRKDSQAEALADLLTDNPGTEEFVESVREEAKQRQIARMLVERGALPEAASGESPRRRTMWLAIIVVVTAGICLLFVPGLPATTALCVIFPLLVLWCLRRLLD